MDLADTLSSLGRLDEAMPLYEAVIALSPEHGGAHYALGIARGRTGDTPGARTALERARELAPDNPLPLLGLARLAAGSGEIDAALRQVDDALVIHPTLFGALLLKGDLLDPSLASRCRTTGHDVAGPTATQALAPSSEPCSNTV